MIEWYAKFNIKPSPHKCQTQRLSPAGGDLDTKLTLNALVRFKLNTSGSPDHLNCAALARKPSGIGTILNREPFELA